MIKYLSLEDVVGIHDRAIIKYGGSLGIRDLGLVKSAVSRPQAGFDNFEAYPDLFIKAAVLGHSLLKNHPFIDGNKRTAIESMAMFLEENSYQIVAKRNEQYRLALAIEDNSINEKNIADWLKFHTRRVKK